MVCWNRLMGKVGMLGIAFLLGGWPTGSLGLAGEYSFERMWPSNTDKQWLFHKPFDVAIDGSGNLLVVDSGNNRIKRFTPDGEFITSWGGFWSSRMTPSENGNGKFDWPSGVAVDKQGNIYVTDSYNHRVQKFNSDGTFILQWGNFGSNDGEFNWPSGIAADSRGYVYVFDNKNHRVQKFSQFGQFILKWGTKGTGEGQFLEPPDIDPLEGKFNGIAVSNEGHILVADRGNSRIQIFSNFGVYQGKFGTYGYDNGALNQPSGIFVDQSGVIYVTDSFNQRIQLFDTQGNYLSKFGGWGIKPSKFKLPEGIAVDQEGFIYIADTSNDRIQVFNHQEEFIISLRPEGDGDGEFFQVHGVVTDPNGDVYVVDRGNARVQRFSLDGNFLHKWGEPGQGDGQFWEPTDISMDSAGNFYVVDTDNKRVQKFDPNGDFLLEWGGKGPGDGQFEWPLGIAISSDDMIYISDYIKNNIQKFDTVGGYVGKWGTEGKGDGEFDHPIGLSVDQNGYVYVADAANHRIQKFSPEGVFEGKWGQEGVRNGEFSWPEDVSVSMTGEVYVADKRNDRIQKFTSDGVFLTMFGQSGTGEGGLSGLSYLSTYKAADGYTRVIVSDTHNNRIQVFTDKPQPTPPPLRAIIVAGGGPYPGNNLWNATQLCTNLAYRVLTYQGYTKDSIYYLSHDSDIDIDGNGLPDDVDAIPTLDNLSYAIREWAKFSDNLVIYMSNHGGPSTFRVSETEVLQAAQLSDWLDSLQETLTGQLIFVYDACDSGSFLSDLTPPPSKNRILITSTAPGKRAAFLQEGSVSFSSFFWDGIANGNTLGEAFEHSNHGMSSIHQQLPQVDANGNGIGNESSDYTAIENIHIGTDIRFGSDIPSFDPLSSPVLLYGETSVRLVVNNVTDADGISRVWAVVIPLICEYSSQEITLPVRGSRSLNLHESFLNSYEILLENFLFPGQYNVVLYAVDKKGYRSLPRLVQVVQKVRPVKMGDMDQNGQIDLNDAITALQWMTGGTANTDWKSIGADIDCNLKIGIQEIIYVLNYIADL